MEKFNVLGTEISFYGSKDKEFICLTDIAKHKDDRTDEVIKNWLRNRNTIEFLGIWEILHNPEFKPVEFDGFRSKAGLHGFVLTAKQWIEKTGAKGIISKQGRYGGTYAHKDIAFEFASWVSVEFKLYLIKEFQRLQEKENKNLDWDIRRNLARINYKIHSEAIQKHLVPKELTREQQEKIYASEADVLNMALFGMTAREWREFHQKGNIRDYANAAQLVCLVNLENLNALFIQEGISQKERLIKLNQIAIQQMKLLIEDRNVKRLV